MILGFVLLGIGIGMLRLGWRRSLGRVTAPLGWALIAVALLLFAARDGAWGLAVGGLFGSTVAFVLLAHALWQDRPAQAVPAHPAPANPRLHQDGRLQLGQRFLTFLLVVPGAMAASLASGLAAQALGRAAGWAEPDSTTLGLFVFPVAWILLATIMMVRNGPAALIKPVAGTLAASGLLFWIAIG